MFNSYSLIIPKVETERGLFFNGVKIRGTLPMHLKREEFYIPFKQGLTGMLID